MSVSAPPTFQPDTTVGVLFLRFRVCLSIAIFVFEFVAEVVVSSRIPLEDVTRVACMFDLLCADMSVCAANDGRLVAYLLMTIWPVWIWKGARVNV